MATRLVLEADRTYLALHHQFDSVEAAIRDGVDIIPNVTNVRVFDKPQRTADTSAGLNCEPASNCLSVSSKPTKTTSCTSPPWTAAGQLSRCLEAEVPHASKTNCEMTGGDFRFQ